MKVGSLNPAILIAVVVGLAICIASLSRHQESQRSTIVEPSLQPAVFSNAPDTTEIDSVFNDEGREFIHWARMRGHCWAVPDEKGIIRALQIDICWYATDDQIEVFAKLADLNYLWMRAENATDVSLGYFAKNPSIKVLYLPATEHKFTNKGLHDFAQRRPDVTLHL